VEYSQAFQKELKTELADAGPNTKKVLADYLLLRDMIRASC
jgi:hypothetical protein